MSWQRAIVLLLAMAAAQGCSVPVFAYALQQWDSAQHSIRTSGGAAWRASANRTVEERHAWAIVTEATAEDAVSGVFWPDEGPPWLDGEITAERLEGLIDSPVRRELVRRLVGGEAVVWLFVPGSDPVADAAALDRLRLRLNTLQAMIELPPPSDIGQALPPLRFSILACPAFEPAEWATLAQLRSLAKQAEGPLFAPVFGRARALACHPARTWDDALIDTATLYLTGPCSCQVKSMNPGSDLLVCADWDDLLATAQPVATPATTPTRPDAVERVVFGADPPAAPGSAPPNLLLWSLAGLGLLLLAVALARRAARS